MEIYGRLELSNEERHDTLCQIVHLSTQVNYGFSSVMRIPDLQESWTLWQLARVCTVADSPLVAQRNAKDCLDLLKANLA